MQQEPLWIERELRHGRTFWTPSAILSQASIYPCVYRVYSSGTEPIYIGRTTNLRSRLWSHNDCTPWWNETIKIIVLFATRVTSTPSTSKSTK